jgi:predicted membrane metal-binding protein
MGSLSLVALLVGRGTSLRRLLGLVHIGMLIYNPYFLVYDVGYILSFSAILGIIFIDVFRKNEKLNRDIDNNLYNGFWSNFFVSKNRFFFFFVKTILRIRSNYLKPSL